MGNNVLRSSRPVSGFTGSRMRARILAVLLCGAAMLGVANAQKMPLHGNPTTPPPIYRAPPMVTPNYSRPYEIERLPESHAQPLPDMRMQQIPLPPCHPHDCETLNTIEEAKREFVQCMNESKGADGKIDSDELQDCVFGWMSPNKFAAFAECWQDTNNSAWTCFNRAYARNEKSSGQASSGYPSQGYTTPHNRPLSSLPHTQPQIALPSSKSSPAGGGVHPFWDCNSGSRVGPDSYDDQLLFECLADILTQAQMDRFFNCVDTLGRGYDFCYDRAIR